MLRISRKTEANCAGENAEGNTREHKRKTNSNRMTSNNSTVIRLRDGLVEKDEINTNITVPGSVTITE